MVSECLHHLRRYFYHHLIIIMIASTALTVMVEFGNHQFKKNAGQKSRISCQHYIHLLAFVLFYGTISRYKCEGSTLFQGNTNSDSHSSVMSFSDRSEHHSTLSPHMNLYTVAAAATSNGGSDSMHIIRNNLGDTFFDDDQTWSSCSVDRCTSGSSGTATIAIESNINSDGKKSLLNRYNNLCYCRCLQNIPAFREDMHVCVDDIHECSLVSFVSGRIEQKIPYVFLPLKGQIVYPNAEIHFNGLKSMPICIISRVRYLSRSGWNDIRNSSISGNDPSNSQPFKLFHDEHRTFLQWLGNSDLRTNLEGRLLLIDLICKESDNQLIFTPCISFRVAGIPNARTTFLDVLDRNANKGAKFSANEYIALSLAALLLALIYIASVFLYLHLKKNKMKERSSRRGNTFRKYINIEDNASHLFGENQSKKLIVEEEGLIKNNPLLMKRYYPSTVTDGTPLSSIDGNRLGEENTFCSLTSNKDQNNSIMDKIDDNVQTKTVSAVIHARGVNNTQPSTKRFENVEQQRWQVFSNRPMNIFGQHYFQQEENSNPFCRKKICERQQHHLEANNIEEKHPDENMSIVECPEDVIQTNSKHKLYFNPAYFEPELLMAPPPAAVEFLTKIREVMTIAKRKMSMKKFSPSLTEIPEELQSTDESKCSFDSKRSSRKIETSQNNSKIQGNPFLQSDNLDYRSKEDKEKRQIIQKWLQSIPLVPEEINSQFKTKITNQSVQDTLSQFNGNQKHSGNNDLSSFKPSGFTPNTSVEEPNKPPLLPKRDDINSYKPSLPLRKKLFNLNENYLPECNHEVKSKPENKDKSKIGVATDDYDGAEQLNLYAHISNNNNFSSNLPMDEELTMHNAIYNIVTGSTTLSKLKARYETNENKLDSITENMDGKYSLVSEVYVNDGFSSSETSLVSLNYSEERDKEVGKVANERKKDHESSRLMIQLNDCPFFYSVENADDFEPDTLDRKPNKEHQEVFGSQMNFVDSLERPAISLRTYGSFRQDPSQGFGINMSSSTLKRTFGSLQEIYELRRKSDVESHRFPNLINSDESPQSLNSQLENMLWRKDKLTPRHRYRQRKQSPPPPLPLTGTSLSYLLPKIAKPPLPPRRSEISLLPDRKVGLANNFKAQSCSELYSPGFHSNFVFENKLNVWPSRPEDSGYLSSSDSDKSKIFSEQKNQINTNNKSNGSVVSRRNEDEDDDDDDDDSVSFCDDGNSESGAESMETNFKFYKNRGKSGRDNCETENVERPVPIMNRIQSST